MEINRVTCGQTDEQTWRNCWMAFELFTQTSRKSNSPQKYKHRSKVCIRARRWI